MASNKGVGRVPLALLEDGLEESLELQWKASYLLRQQQCKVLDKRIQHSLEEVDREAHFESPNWQLKMAYQAGRRAALREVKQLLTHVDDEVPSDV